MSCFMRDSKLLFDLFRCNVDFSMKQPNLDRGLVFVLPLASLHWNGHTELQHAVYELVVAFKC